MLAAGVILAENFFYSLDPLLICFVFLALLFAAGEVGYLAMQSGAGSI